MFDTVEMLMDTYGRPIFVLDQDFGKKSYHIDVYDERVDFFSDKDKIGSVEIDEPSVLHLVATQEKVGLIVWDEEKTEDCPDTLTYVATVKDNREI